MTKINNNLVKFPIVILRIGALVPFNARKNGRRTSSGVMSYHVTQIMIMIREKIQKILMFLYIPSYLFVRLSKLHCIFLVQDEKRDKLVGGEINGWIGWMVRKTSRQHKKTTNFQQKTTQEIKPQDVISSPAFSPTPCLPFLHTLHQNKI